MRSKREIESMPHATRWYLDLKGMTCGEGKTKEAAIRQAKKYMMNVDEKIASGELIWVEG